MIPEGRLQTDQNSAPSSSTFNKVSSMGMGEQNDEAAQQSQPKQESLKDVAAKQFGAVFKSVESLFSSYQGAPDEAQTVRTALANWLKTAISSINESGSNSTY